MNVAPEAAERAEHFTIREVRVPPAGIGQHEDRRALERLRLQAKRNRLAGPPRKDGAKQRHADEGNDLRLHAADLSSKRARTGDVLIRTQRIDAGRRPRDEVGDPEAPLRQPAIVGVADRLVDEPRFMEELPEAIRVAGEMMAGHRRADAGVDADEEDADRRPDAVAERR
jgi:hypothetical protein